MEPTAIFFDGGGDNLTAVISNGDVCFQESDLSFFFEFRKRGFIFVTAKDDDFIAAGKKFFRSGKTDSFGSAGNDNDLIHEKSPFVYVCF